MRSAPPLRLLREFLPIAALLSGLVSLAIWPLVRSIEQGEVATLTAEARGALQESRSDIEWRFFETLADIRVISQLPRVREAVNSPTPEQLRPLNGIFRTFMESYGRYSSFTLVNRQGRSLVHEGPADLTPGLEESTTCANLTQGHEALLAKAWALDPGQFVVSPVHWYQDQATKPACQPLMELAVPMGGSPGKVEFVLLVHILLNPLLQEQHRILQLHNISVLSAILDPQGHAINSNTTASGHIGGSEAWTARPDPEAWLAIRRILFEQNIFPASLRTDRQGLFIFSQVNPLNTRRVPGQQLEDGTTRPSRQILAMEAKDWPWVLLIQIPNKTLQTHEYLGTSKGWTLLVALYLSAALVALSLAYARLLRRLSQEDLLRHSAELELLARTDSLTGLPNRRSLEELVNYELARWQRHQIPLAVLMLDLDHFKTVNDQNGHAVGDAVLVAFSRTCQAELRNTDTLARWGGEEFLALLPNTDHCQAETLAERLRQAVAALSIPVLETADPAEAPSRSAATLRITTSIGIASCHDDSGNFDTLLREADEALYAAKEAGRNCIRYVQTGLQTASEWCPK
ncbi:diguanylate cyclase [Synechococcus sp. CBW1107]|uniref:GGDEF domain-containing protein n=1 Tax=Synechococcus sp. CBW1107 TaxID=2789857 RepID=UPI002AD41644|nr:diguanylate cyclase [Synechococcus sp. CBW1107]